MTLQRLRPNWVRHAEEGWEVRIVDRDTLRYVDGGSTTDVPIDMGLDGQRAVVHLDPADVGGAGPIGRVRTALDFLDVTLVLDQPGGAS